MDSPEATKLVYDRIQKLEPQLVSKIIAYVLLQDNGEQEMIRFACGPDNSIHSLIAEAKSLLFGNHPNVISGVYRPSPISPGSNFRNGTIWLDTTGLDLPEGYLYPKQVQRMSSSTPPFHRAKPCLYFQKGSCKHGINCRYSHATPNNGQNFPQHGSLLTNDPGMEDQGLSRGTLERLELEISELLKSRGGSPVSIASLPMLYYDKYGKTLQAEGYLTESQRNGKTGYSLSKLLGRLKNSIRLIDRPHGQHSVILAEDFHKYSDYDCIYPIVSGSPEQQIYLTFPADSAFTERDVSNYFSEYGPVLDVRIPCQHKRMFGFVTFVFPETAKQILAMGRPHFIRQARVLVKPYKEKDDLPDRKYPEKMQSMACYNQKHLENESEIHSMPEFCGVSRFRRDDQAEANEYTLELERMRLAELQVTPNEFPRNHHNFIYSMDHLIPPEAINQTSSSEYPSRNHMSYSSFDVVNNSSCSKGQPSSSDNTSGNHMNYSSFDVVINGSCSKGKIFNWNDQDSSQGINLPESPFSSGFSIVTTQQSLELDRT